MSAVQQQGEAQALPIARAFLAIGGRLMLNPQGRLEVSSGMRWALPDIGATEARRSFVIERRLCRRLGNASFAKSVRCLVAIEGTRTEGGWSVVG